MKKITQYLNNQLPEQEQEQITRVLLANYFDRKLEQRWNKILEEQYNVPMSKKERTRRIPLFWKKILAAASVVLLLTAVPIYQSYTQLDVKTLVANYLSKKHDNLSVKKGVAIEDARTLAIDAYSVDDFKRAIYYYEQVVNASNSLIEDHFYLGLSYLYDGQTEKAIEVLQRVNTLATSSNFKSKEINDWYLSLAYLQAHKTEPAKALLQKIVKENTPKKQDAAELLEKL